VKIRIEAASSVAPAPVSRRTMAASGDEDEKGRQVLRGPERVGRF
jgi:hypothetical protein